MAIVAHKSALVTPALNMVLQLFSNFNDSAADPGFDRAERLLHRFGDFAVRHPAQQRKLDRVTLFIG
jgi:hypothetical protein